MRERLQRGFMVNPMSRCEITLKSGEKKRGNWVYGAYHKHLPTQPFPIGEASEPVLKHLIVKDSFADWGLPREIEGKEIILETLGDYIGLQAKDPLGRAERLFEGDVVHISYEGMGGSISTEARLICNDGYVPIFLDEYGGVKTICQCKDTQMTILGNVWESRELLKYFKKYFKERGLDDQF